MAETYIMVIAGKPEGPFTITELQARGLKPADFVKTEAMIDYKEAHEIAELREILGFTKPPVIPQYFGSFDQRLLASFIDWLIITGVYVVPVLLIVLISPGKMFDMILSGSLLVVIPITYVVYHIVMESGPKQATYGKQILKIKVTDMQGYPINTSTAIGRNLSKIFSVLTLGVGYLLNFFNKRQQCMHRYDCRDFGG
ncbi:RDD family protein [Mucilaginibacter agri]|uniref:DUF4339 domain-containing protein n=1 Tax=Mucilaginibacter agri TaxID=2695265 RepID=A0A965ZJY8_9SPHI|nr:RDD family protein [Mucilaginibacter agri]NCD71458.1 DUF4339 domain-containing protein [Mucilaginibacter agri]